MDNAYSDATPRIGNNQTHRKDVNGIRSPDITF